VAIQKFATMLVEGSERISGSKLHQQLFDSSVLLYLKVAPARDSNDVGELQMQLLACAYRVDIADRVVTVRR
jgi:hypothetical protein